MGESLTDGAIAALKEHPPFDEMDAAALRFLASNLSVAYYPRGTMLVGPESGIVERLFIVRQGAVRGSGTLRIEAAADVVLGAGECFPIGALVGRRATVYDYRAEGDVFCWELPAPAFQRLVEMSPRFHAFCTNHLAMLVERSHRALRAEAGEALADDAGMLAPLRSVLRRPVVSCAPQTPLREVLASMREARIGSMVVAGADRVPVGIFTTVDVLEKVAAPQASVEAPISSVMTPRPVALEEEATLADAAIAMVRHGIRHVVVTRDGRLTGVVSERDLFALQRMSLRRTAERIHAAGTNEALAEAAADIRALARHLLAQGVAAEQLTAMVSALNDALTHKAIGIFAEKHRLGSGWCWLALGSEGRMEQTLVTDQDNAIIFSEGDRTALLAFAHEVNEALDAAGFPLCKGDIMARNPRWCLGAQEWRAVFDDWIRNPDPEALLHAAIFFDLRPLAGEAQLAGALREGVLAQTKANRAFLRGMTQAALKSAPPLGLLKDFSADELDLKAQGARVFVDAARILALAEGIGETSTARRLRAKGEAQAAEAFHFVQGLRLRHGNRVRPAALSPIDRRILKEAFREAALLQQRIRMDFGL
jgi:CBS domain-containing protein